MKVVPGGRFPLERPGPPAVEAALIEESIASAGMANTEARLCEADRAEEVDTAVAPSPQGECCCPAAVGGDSSCVVKRLVLFARRAKAARLTRPRAARRSVGWEKDRARPAPAPDTGCCDATRNSGYSGTSKQAP